ncbi:TolC family outer membrane protein [Pseudoduganella sp. UC29_106]|uniref:TolC family outer membrane protein n=1 Tax=Pseudoduganella sp. UC29_106 TaxID=3374553 RepID=UPI003756319D
MKTTLFAGACVAAALAGALPLSVNAMDLMGAWQHALDMDPSLMAAGAAREAGAEKKVQGDALFKPRVNLTAAVTHLDTNSGAFGPPQLSNLLPTESKGTRREASLTLVQPIYRADYRAARKQMHSQSAIAELSYDSARQDQIQRVAQAYFNVLLAEERVRLLDAQLAATGEQAADAKARFDAGRARIIDLRDAEARRESVQSLRIAAGSELELRRVQFFEQTGMEAGGLAVMREGFAPQASSTPLAAWEQKAQDNNPQLQTRLRQLESARAETERHKRISRPTLDLVASHGEVRTTGDVSPLVSPERTRSNTIGLQLNIPLYQGGALDSQQREAAARLREAQFNVDAARRDVRLQVRDAWLAVSDGAAQVLALEQSVKAARTAQEAAELGREVGMRTTLDVLNAQQSVYSAMYDLSKARVSWLMGSLRLSAAAGGLGEGEVRAVNAYLAER